MTTPVTPKVTNTGPTLNDRVVAQIRALMAARRRTTTQLADALGISQSTASRRLQGDGTFTLNQVGDIAAWLDVPLADILVPSQSYSP